MSLLHYVWMGILEGSLIFVLCVVSLIRWLPHALEEGKESRTRRGLDQSPARAWRLQRNGRAEFTRILSGQQEACMTPELVNLNLERESVYKIKEEEHVKAF